VRAVYAFIEAVVWDMKDFCSGYAHWLEEPLSPAEIVALKEKTVQLSSSGLAKEVPLRVGFRENLKFALRNTQKVVGGEGSPDFGGQGWQGQSLVSRCGTGSRTPSASPT
jgi:hypothetical protein